MRADELCFGWLKRIAGMKGRPQSVTYGDARQRAVSLIAAEPWSWTSRMLSALNPTDCSPTGHQSREETSLCRNEVAPQIVGQRCRELGCACGGSGYSPNRARRLVPTSLSIPNRPLVKIWRRSLQFSIT
jgi:hypothetical protein